MEKEEKLPEGEREARKVEEAHTRLHLCPYIVPA